MSKEEKVPAKAGTWTRPANVLPKIWLRENGIVVRDVTPDLDKYVLEHMLEHFARDEPLNQSLRLSEDPDSLKDLEDGWGYLLSQRVSLVALEEGTPGSNLETVGIENAPIVLGANVLQVSVKSEIDGQSRHPVWKGEASKKMAATLNEIAALENVYERYGVNTYLDAMGLSVCPQARGRGLGFMLLRARFELCRGLNIPVTKTIFTSIQSQKIAAKAGFQILVEKEYDEIKGPDGQRLYPDMAPTKTIQLCARTVS